MAQRGITRQATTAGRPISSNDNALRSTCKRCRRTIYTWQTTEWLTGRIIGLAHADKEDCES